jgi:site-specific recombinase XerD
MTEPLPLLADLIALFLEDRIAKGVSPHTLRGYRDKLAYFAVWAQDRPLTRATVRAYLAHLRQKPISPHTVHSYFRDVRTLGRWLVEEELLAADPAHKLAPQLPKRRPASYTPDQVQRLLSVCNPRDRALIIFLLDTGVRRAELLQLQRRSISMTGLCWLRVTSAYILAPLPSIKQPAYTRDGGHQELGRP